MPPPRRRLPRYLRSQGGLVAFNSSVSVVRGLLFLPPHHDKLTRPQMDAARLVLPPRMMEVRPLLVKTRPLRFETFIHYKPS